MSDSTYAITLDAPHPTMPDVLVNVALFDDHNAAAPVYAPSMLWGEAGRRFQLWIPSLDTWTLETVRMVLCELSAFLPYDPNAEAGVKAGWRKPRGRRPSVPRAPEFDPDVELWVRARGWRAAITTDRNERQIQRQDGTSTWGAYLTGQWTAPMVDALIELTGRSPFRFAAVQETVSADPFEHDLKFNSRYAVQHGLDVPLSLKLKRREEEAFLRAVKAVRALLNKLRDEGGQR